MSTEILEQSPLYQEWTRNAREQGRQEGIEEGLRQAALAVLRGRFGELPPEAVTALSAADQGTLDSLLPHLAAITMDELRARLSLV